MKDYFVKSVQISHLFHIKPYMVWSHTGLTRNNMKLSTKGQYAITAMMNLAINYNVSPLTLTEISNSQTISLSYLEQLFSMLRNAGLVEGVRGPGGGYRLRKPPNQISITDIIEAIEESSEPAVSEVEICTPRKLWNDFSSQLSEFLSSITLADFMQDQVVMKSQYQLDETTRRISNMFPVSANVHVA